MFRVVAVVFIFLMSMSAFAASIDISTSNTTNWVVTGGGVSAPAFNFNPVAGSISLTGNGNPTGNFISTGSIANFNGLWYADFAFMLPATASDITLSFSNLLADDRVVLQLNGDNIGNEYLNHFIAEPGVMSFPGGSGDVPFFFTPTITGTVTSGFLLGQTNDLRMIVNNTDSADPSAPTIPLAGAGDYTYARLTGTINYSIPEPSSLCLGLVASAFVVLLYLIGRRQQVG